MPLSLEGKAGGILTCFRDFLKVPRGSHCMVLPTLVVGRGGRRRRRLGAGAAAIPAAGVSVPH